MACNTKITAAIINSCNPVKGFDKVWLGNRNDFIRTVTNNEVSIAKNGVVVLYTATGYKDFMNGGAAGKINEMLPTAFTHKITLNLTVGTAAEQKNIDKADDIIVFAKRKGSGQILAYGITNGLWKSSQSQMANDNNSLTAVEFATRDGEEEEYSCYFAQQTEAALDALLV